MIAAKKDSVKQISYDELSKHNTSADCWVAIHGNVYDVTSFLPEHPGGESIILKYAGKDATPGFEPIHNKDIVNLLPPEAFIGKLDTTSKALPQLPPKEQPAPPSSVANAATSQPHGLVPVIAKPWTKPPIEHMLNIFDFEAVAQQVMKKEGWDYYSSGADDEITLRENHAAFQRVWLRPRVLVNVATIDTRCRLLGDASSIPIYITATALGKLAHPEGEVVLTRAAAAQGVIQMCPTLASCSLDEMIAAKAPGQVQWFQLYVNRDRKITADIVRRAEQGGIKALCITVDAPQLGRREKDMRNKFSAAPPDVQKKEGVKRDQGTARAISTFIDPSLAWEDIKWFRTITKMRIVLKGIQCGEDAILAAEHGVDGIIVSNHGGRQLDYARSGIEMLPEIMDALRSIGAEKKIEVYVDGGVRRGTDVFKALALGAKAVGIGRPVLYGMAAYGQDGVERVLQIFKEELDVCMRLMGTPTLEDIKPNMVITRNLGDHFAPQPKDYLATRTYIPLPKL